MGQGRGAVEFDVSHDAGRDDDVAPAAGSPSGWRARWRAASRGQRRVVAGIAAASVLVLAGGAAVAGLQADRVEADRLRTAPGAVRSLDGPLTDVWRADVDALVAVLPDGGLATTDGSRLVVREVADGTERWSVELTDDPVCGPAPRPGSPLEWAVPVATVTCVHGSADARVVTVLDAGGAVVGQRELDPDLYGGATRAVAPAADGGLLVAEHVSDLPAQLTFATPDQMFSRLSRLEVQAGPADVRLEDALTGERRATLEVTTVPEADGLDCYDMTETVVDASGLGTSGRAVLDLGTPQGTPTMVLFDGCATDGAATYSGVALGTQPTGVGPWPPPERRQPYPGDRFVVPEGGGSALLAADGTPVLEARGWRLQVPATDGTAGDGHVAVASDRVLALTEDGAERWEAPQADARVLVRTADVVVAGGWNRLTGYDPADGTERWTLEPDAGPNRYVLSAVTDGPRMAGVLLETSTVGRAELSLFVLDLATGQEVAPRIEVDARHVVAVDGHLLVLEPAEDEVLTGDVAPRIAGLRVLAPAG
ncbi:hypothetical protein GCM10023216_28060 [Isoptericola chiayiensis]|uniref:Pyrrolo-quinoline quinone repeat domain-containing protein n=1 Tax=Isoptericola chiayiensis TaxID=579446 RepID=A0ABP8YLR6_9MICO|nr:PQQ-binding-like beta-propeller repeat protein [Isoptericola chiayiensis]NOW02273.1 outer membrane protein assembly factor BamB [Isoptericola chiayiensis]